MVARVVLESVTIHLPKEDFTALLALAAAGGMPALTQARRQGGGRSSTGLAPAALRAPVLQGIAAFNVTRWDTVRLIEACALLGCFMF